jgi:hypothetical protein
VIRPGWRALAMGAVRDRSRWLRVAIALLLAVCALYTVLGMIAFFTTGVDTIVAGVRITITHPQKMWWIAGAVFAAAFAAVVIATCRRTLVAPALAFLVSTFRHPRRIGNRTRRPHFTAHFHGLVAAWPDITGVMLPMLLGRSDDEPHDLHAARPLRCRSRSGPPGRRRRRMNPSFTFFQSRDVMFFVSGRTSTRSVSLSDALPPHCLLSTLSADDVLAMSKPSGLAGWRHAGDVLGTAAARYQRSCRTSRPRGRSPVSIAPASAPPARHTGRATRSRS